MSRHGLHANDVFTWDVRRSARKSDGSGWDVGAAVRFLAGDEARWMTALSKSTDEFRASGRMLAERRLPLIYRRGVRDVC